MGGNQRETGDFNTLFSALFYERIRESLSTVDSVDVPSLLYLLVSGKAI